MKTQTETRLDVKVQQRDTAHSQIEEIHRELDGGEPTDVQRRHIEELRETMEHLDVEIDQLDKQVQADKRADEKSRMIRKAALIQTDGADAEDDGIVYRTMAAYARDVLLTGQGREVGKIQALLPQHERDAARQRLELLQRVPANTLSSNVAGLQPNQHIAQIFQIIDSSRPLVASAQRATLERGTLSYPSVDTRPVVAVQSTQKTEAGNTGMAISMKTTTASTYLGGGDLSWQAINWSTPNALDLWFRLVAADYALKTEQDAAQALQHSAFSYNTSTTLSATPTFAEFMTAIGAGYGEVWSGSSRIIDTIYMAPDRYGYILGLTSSTPAMFTNVSTNQIAGLNVVVSRGMDAGVIVVGDSQALLVAETAGAPVELRVVEPAIGGVEVGLIGAFEAVVTDPGAFSMITTAS